MSTTNKNLAGHQGQRFEFGMSTPSVVSGLRELADALENGTAVIQSATTYRKVDKEEYPVSAVVLKFVESLGERTAKSLHSPERALPVDVAIRAQ